MVWLVCSWRREKRDKKIVEVTDSCFKIIWYEITTSGYILTSLGPGGLNKMNPLEIIQRLILVMFDNFKSQEMCIKAV